MNDGKLERYVLHPKHAEPTHATPAAPTHATPEKNHQFTNQSSSPLPTLPPTSTHNSTPSYNHSSAHNSTRTFTRNSIHTTTHNSTHTSTRNSTRTSIHNYTIDSTTKPSLPEIGIKTVAQLATFTNKLKAKSERRRPASRQPEKLATVGVSTVGGVAIENGVRAYSQLTAENERDIEEFERSLLANFESSEIHKSADSNIVALQRLRISQASARTTVGIRNGRPSGNSPSGRGQTTARPLRISEATNAYRSSSLRATMPSRLNVVKAVPRRLSDDDDEMSALFSRRAVREKYLVKTIGGILAGFTVVAILIGAVVIKFVAFAYFTVSITETPVNAYNRVLTCILIVK